MERDYNAFTRTIRGEKIVRICRILAYGITTVRELEQSLGFSRSEIRKLLKLAEEHEWVLSQPTSRTKRSRGKPRKGGFERASGRPSTYYSLAPNGLFYMRFDPELSDKWKDVEQTYGASYEQSIFDSYNNLKYAIRKHPTLSKLKPWYFDGELQRTLLNPLLFGASIGGKQFDELSDDLVRLVEENVKPEFIKNYRSTLQSSVSRMEKILSRHKLMIRKIETISSQQTA